MGSSEVVLKTTKLIQHVCDRLRVAQRGQKSYVDWCRLDLEFQVGDFVLQKVSPWKGIIRFWRRGKLGPQLLVRSGFLLDLAGLLIDWTFWMS